MVRTYTLVVMGLALLLVWSAWAREFTIFWPDVEQGSCTLVVGPETEGHRNALLIDAGTRRGTTPEVSPVAALAGFLQQNQTVVIKHVVITHQHEDHLSWIDSLRSAGLIPPDAMQYTRLNVYPGNAIDLGGGATAHFIIANGVVRRGETLVQVYSSTDENERSIGILISYKDLQTWIGGDLGSAVEAKIADLIGDVDIYVMHHHGSATSSTRPFLDALKPEVTICQVGDGNTYGHPTVEALTRVIETLDTDGDRSNGTPLVILQNRGSYTQAMSGVYIADPDGRGGRSGEITLTSDGWSYRLQAYGLPDTMSFTTDGSVPREGASAGESVSAGGGVATLASHKYRLSLVSNQMPVYHSRDFWVLIVYLEGHPQGTILCTQSPSTQAIIFELFLTPGEERVLWVAAVDPEANPDIGQTRYILKVPNIAQGETVTFSIEFTITGDSGGPASMTFTLTRIL